jgi:hypothetical protein
MTSYANREANPFQSDMAEACTAAGHHEHLARRFLDDWHVVKYEANTKGTDTVKIAADHPARCDFSFFTTRL